MDDEVSIVGNEQIRSFSNTGEILTQSFFGGQAYYRPLVALSYMVEYHLFGLKPFYYYLTNILIHIATSITLFYVMNFIFRRQLFAFAIALLFAIHPVHWEAVANISGRAILLCAFFYMNAFLLFCRAGKNKWVYALSLISFIFALLSKESAGMLPVLLLSYQFFLGREIPPYPPFSKGGTSCAYPPSPPPLKKGGRGGFGWVLPVLPFFFLDAVYILFRRLLGITHWFQWQSIGDSALGFLTFLRSVITALRLFVMPVDLHFDRSQKLFSGFFEWGALATLLFFVVLIILFVRFKAKLSPGALFFISWFCIELFPVSQIPVSIGVRPGYISTAEHFLYTPAVGIFALAVLGAMSLRPGRFISPGGFKVITAGCYGFLFLMTVQANIYAAQEIAMFERTLAISPHNTRVRNSLGLSLAKLNRFAEAEYHFRKVLVVDPLHVRARIGLGKSLCDQGKFQEGIREYETIKDAGDLSPLLAENLELTYRLLSKQKYNILK